MQMTTPKPAHNQSIGTLPKEWREVKLGDVVTLNYGKSLPARKRAFGNIPVYSSAGITGWHNKALIKNKGIIVGRKGTIGSVYKSKTPFFPIDTVFYISHKDTDCDLSFLFYILSNLKLYNLNSDSAVPGLNRNTAYAQEIPLPPLSEQKAIAEVLSSLDDKIDLLHRQNKTLEDMAQTLFRQWFIEQANAEWKKVKLGDFFPVITGEKDANYSTTNGEYPFFTCSHSISHAPNYSFNGKAILFAGNGNFNVKRYEGKFEAYQRVYVLIPNEDKYCGFLYTLIKFNLKEITVGARGSVIRFITKGMITDFTFTLPKTNFDDKLKHMNDIYLKVDFNQAQINTLENLRGTLLPKLMSGEVRIK